MLKILKKLLWSVLIFIVLLVSVLTLIWFRPQILLNEKTLAYFSQRLKIAGHQISWENLHIDIQNVDHFKRKIFIQAENFCAKDSLLNNFNVCIPLAKINFSIEIKTSGISLIEIDELSMLDMTIFYRVEPRRSAVPDDQPIQPIDTIKWFETLSTMPPVFNVRINAKEFMILTSDQMWEFEFSLKGHILQKEIALKLDIDAPKNHPQWTQKSKVQIYLSSQDADRLPLHLEAHASLISREGEKIDLQLFDNHHRHNFYPIELSGKVKVDLKQHKIDLAYGLDYSPEQISALFKGRYNGITIPINVQFGQCKLNLNLAHYDKDLLMDCPLTVKAKKSLFAKVPGKENLIKSLEGNLGVSINNFSTEALKSKGNIKISFKSKKGKPIELNTTIFSQLPSFPEKGLPELEEMKPEIFLTLKLLDINRLFRFLEAFESGPPAPFHSFKGPLTLQLESSYNDKQDALIIPFTLTADLTSPNQVLLSEINGQVSFMQKNAVTYLALKMNADIQKAKLILPTLGHRKLPRLFEDKRIKKSGDRKPTSKDNNLILNYQVAIKTEKNAPLYIQSNLAKEKIPVHMDIHLENEKPLSGKIWVDSFLINLFRKDAKINYLSLKSIANSKKEIFDIKGKLTISYTDYIIYLLIAGPSDHLRLTFQSDPPLPEKDIISILFFGYPIEEGTSEEADSVSNIQAAAARGAIGLASLYFFASTPIESIRYDPSLNRYTAKIRVAKGTSLTVGSGEVEGGIYGLRKRLGKDFYISTEYQEGGSDKDSSTTTLLEWILRY